MNFALPEPEAVLFCCTLNAIRSPMAEGLTKSVVGTRLYVDSVGVRSKEADGFMIEVMAEIGIDMRGHSPKNFDDLADGSFDLIIALSPEAQHHAVEMTRTMACEVEFWNTFLTPIIEGGRNMSLEAFRTVRDQLRQKLKNAFQGQAHDRICIGIG